MEKIKGGSMKSKGPWIHRFSIRLFTLFLAVLVYWVLGFLVQDIESIQGPSYTDIEQRHVHTALVEKQKTLAADIAEADRAIAGKHEEMRIISDSTRNLQSTINQLIELQKLTVQKSAALSETEQANLSDSLAWFLDNQTHYRPQKTPFPGLVTYFHRSGSPAARFLVLVQVRPVFRFWFDIKTNDSYNETKIIHK
jgi:hypothetical protein